MKMAISLIIFLSSSFLVGITIASPPTRHQVAESAWLTDKLYTGVNALNKDTGCVIYGGENGEFAVWKHYRTKECYVVIRGTNNLGDIFTDGKVVQVYDEETGVDVHLGVKERTESIINQIGDRLKVCYRHIIITGHSLGGAVSHFVFLKYVKRHYYDWGDKQKASRFKAVMFGAPQLITKTHEPLLLNYEKNINWYKHEHDPVPELVRTIKGCILFAAIGSILSGQFYLSAAAFTILKGVRYGDYVPGNKYYLWANGETEEYNYRFGMNTHWWDHVPFSNTLNAFLIKGWGTEDVSDNKDDKVVCSNFGFNMFVDEEKNPHFEENPYENETININTSNCEDVKKYNLIGKFQDVVLYLKGDNTSYIIKRILDNEKEYEYAICGDNGFVLKQCDAKCNCHEVLKNDRPKNITLCSSYQLDSAMSCMIDEKIKKVYMSSYFSLIGQTKIEDYYLMDYFCKSKNYQRGNYKNSQKYYFTNILLLFILISLGI